jgi:hypothetical protein
MGPWATWAATARAHGHPVVGFAVDFGPIQGTAALDAEAVGELFDAGPSAPSWRAITPAGPFP